MIRLSKGGCQVARYQRVLIATDFSEEGNYAAEAGVELARRDGAQLILLHVIEHFPEDLPTDPIGPENTDPRQFLVDRARKALAHLADACGCKDATQEIILSARSAKRVILQIAKERGVDLIVMGAHGRGGHVSFLGSTAMGVLNGVPCDMLVIPTRT
jgi:universal stress protein A